MPLLFLSHLLNRDRFFFSLFGKQKENKIKKKKKDKKNRVNDGELLFLIGTVPAKATICVCGMK